MSNPVIDTVIFVLLVISVGFGAIGVIGLFLFPDLRSRMYTAFRASVIGMSAMVVSVIIFALSIFQSKGGGQYVTLIIHALVFLGIVAGANWVLYTTILRQLKSSGSCQNVSIRNVKNQDK